MKLLAIATLVLGFATVSFAQSARPDSACTTKQKNAASFALAQREALSVQSITVFEFIPGPWTEAVGENVGTDKVRVGGGTRMSPKYGNYAVSAKQIGTSDDCDILSVSEAK